MSTILERQFDELRARFSAAEKRLLPSGTTLVSLPAVLLPEGWSAGRTTIRFLVPVAYPYAALDCFWADNNLRLSSGNLPQNAASDNPIPETSESGLWFSWHLTTPWDANRDTLSGWMNTIIDRLRRIQ